MLPGLLKDTLSKDWKTRARAALGLRNEGAAATSALIRLLLNDDNTKVRGVAAESLGKICPMTAIMPLVEALGDSERGKDAAAALANILMGCGGRKLDAFEERLEDAFSLPRLNENIQARAAVRSLKRKIAEMRGGAFMGGIMLSRERLKPPRAGGEGIPRRPLSAKRH